MLLFGTVSPAVQTKIQDKVMQYADLYGVSRQELYKVVECESGFDPGIQSFHPSPTGPNGREDSWGLAQINLPYHPDITREQAVNPDFALDYIASEFAKGHKGQWSCYKLLKQSGVL